ncbi:hypothetical protein HMPREF1991_01064 [Hoylesella loescheii DSM 19665 = JCM 12249 = ATCC 15930]|uniref:Uncharacterized protein n=1 Tax=Hoylesella loescheii DSM 19665 = JCM 12249 = ATCC 15930 TaxID=1122985 RepID=A0A069QSK2_HOYLO|nr:hypothetical protein HMPREF1991_01064 [Hoylesella loescheii DSM 19665 = JCM 12249 = ATCC 15930]
MFFNWLVCCFFIVMHYFCMSLQRVWGEADICPDIVCRRYTK